MDMRKFSGGVIKPEDLHNGPLVEKIVNISEHDKHGCAVLVFESGDEFYCWNNYARILSRAWGFNSADWIGQELELSLGHYVDRKTEEQRETIVVRPISPAKPGANGGASQAVVPGGASSMRREMDDDIPFTCEWR